MALTAQAVEVWMPRLAKIGMLVAPIGLLPFIQWLYEETLLTATHGPQSLFFSLAHGQGFQWLGPFSVVGYFGFLVAPFFLLWLLFYALFLFVSWRRKAHNAGWHIVLLIATVAPPVLCVIPYDFWLAILT
jgi:hypothetical protein